MDKFMYVMLVWRGVEKINAPQQCGPQKIPLDGRWAGTALLDWSGELLKEVDELGKPLWHAWVFTTIDGRAQAPVGLAWDPVWEQMSRID